ncbi:MAG: hypothetical protein ACRDGI_08155, partial [Candidatus Limnocylindrales bacterium]
MTDQQQDGPAPEVEATASAAPQAPEESVAAVAVADEPANLTEAPTSAAATPEAAAPEVAAPDATPAADTAPQPEPAAAESAPQAEPEIVVAQVSPAAAELEPVAVEANG